MVLVSRIKETWYIVIYLGVLCNTSIYTLEYVLY